MLKHINALADKYPKVLKLCRGKGLMLGMEFADHDLGYEVAKELFSRQILISGTYINAQVLRIEPPLVISYALIDRFPQGAGRITPSRFQGSQVIADGEMTNDE